MRDPSADRLARRVLAGDVELATSPGVADATQRREDDTIHRRFEALTGERLVEHPLDGPQVEATGAVDDRGDRVLVPPGGRLDRHGIGGPWTGECPQLVLVRGTDAIGCLARSPTLAFDEVLHRRKPGERSLVVQPISSRGAGRGHDAVPALPDADGRDRDAGALCCLLDGVHRLSTVAREKHLTII